MQNVAGVDFNVRSLICYALLLLYGDIETNPGPVKYCPVCELTVEVQHCAISCQRVWLLASHEIMCT
jgi:hypothetical protein